MDDIIKILLVEDQITDAELAEYEIKKTTKSYVLKWVDSKEKYTQALEEFDPDIIVSDYNLPSFSGLEALKIKQAVKPDTPLIIFTGSLNEDIAVGCMKAGAVDYVIKEHMKRLGSAIASALEQKKLELEKRKAEEELMLSEAKFRRLADNIPDVIYRYQLNPEQKIEYINPAIERITGYTPQDHYNDPSLFKSLIHSEDKHLFEIKGKTESDFYKPTVIRWRKKDGAIIWMEQRSIPLYNRNGNIMAIEGLAHDITERKNDEILKQAIYSIAQAANSTKSLDDLYSEVHNTIATIMPANNFYIALFHKDTDEISFPFFIDEKDVQPKKRKFQKGLTEYVITTGKSLLCNSDCSKKLKKEGKIEIIGALNTIWLGIPLNFGDNTIGIMALQHYQDETVFSEKEKNMLEFVSTQVAKAIVYKQAERKIQENAEQIEVQNKELHELINELNQNNSELVIAKEKAEESDKLKTAFLQNMSHEIRTPMNAIVGFSELMELEINDPEKLIYYTQVIKQRSNDLLEIINELLDIARIEAGQLNLKAEPVDLNLLVDQLFSLYQEHKEQIGKPYIGLIKKEVPKYINSTIQSDLGKLKQIFVNLIHNAFKFTNDGQIEFGFHSVTNENITLYVADTGIGIPDNMKEIIFERFRKSADESVYVQDGIGLGLAIVKGLLKIFNGNIWVESEPDKGSTFYFSIPYNPVKQQVTNELPIIVTHFDWSNHTILIVEDDTFNIALFIELLHDTKIEYQIATTGKKASLLFNSNMNIDLVLMDIKLPDISGFELTTEFKKIRPEIPIIAQTAFAADADKRRAIEAGCDDFITKPIKRDALLAILNKYLIKTAK